MGGVSLAAAARGTPPSLSLLVIYRQDAASSQAILANVVVVAQCVLRSVGERYLSIAEQSAEH